MATFSTFCESVKTRQFPIAWPGHRIGGQWVPHAKGKSSIVSVNPSRDKPLMEVGQEKRVITQAIDSAATWRKSLGTMPLWERMRVLRAMTDVLAKHRDTAEAILGIEVGKPRWEAVMEVDAALRHWDWVITHSEDLMESLLAPGTTKEFKGNCRLQPIGVTLGHLPFNAPVTTFAAYWAATMLAGCPLVLMPSSHALMSGLLFAYIAEAAMVPPDALNVVFGEFEGFKIALADKRVEAVLYTGSHEHCEAIRQESRQFFSRQLLLQSGGKNSVIVHASADGELATRAVAHGLTKTAGQLCASTSRVFVPREWLPKFSDTLVDVLKNMPVAPTDEPPLKADAPSPACMGPLYSKKAVEKFLRFETMAHREGKTLLWGKALDLGVGGYFVSPGVHLINQFDATSAYQRNVLFCPNLAIYAYDDVATAIEQANSTEAPFVMSWIGDPEVLAGHRAEVAASNVMVNLPTVEIEATHPFAGKLQAGHYRFSGPGMALLLTYPQIFHDVESDRRRMMQEWPWPSL